MSTYMPSHPLDSPFDHRGVLNIVSWFLAIATSLVILARLGTRWVVTGSFGLDDGLIVASMLFAIAQTVSLSVAVGNGLGLVGQPLNPSQLDAQQKDIYVFNILFVVSQALVKSSVLVFIRMLTPVVKHQILCRGLLIGVIAWAIAACFGLSFQCTPGAPWQCVEHPGRDPLAVYTAVQAVNGAFDVALILIPTVITLALHLRRDRKIIILATFSARILVIAATITQLVFLYQPSSAPSPFLTWYFALSTQIVEYLSIISANAPYLRPFLESLSSGMIGNGDIKRRTGAGTQQHTASRLSNMLRSPLRPNGTVDAFLGPRDPSLDTLERLRLKPMNTSVEASGDIERQPESSLEWDRASFQHVIQQTRTFSVRSSHPVYAPSYRF